MRLPKRADVLALLEGNMKIASAATLAAVSFLAFAPIGPAFANSDDDAWIAKCVGDNSDQGQSAETIAVYCSCMNGKMSSSETLSITAWEKKHPVEEKACSKAANWKG
jgi:hypothetical protein